MADNVPDTFDSDYSVNRPTDHLYNDAYLQWKRDFLASLGVDTVGAVAAQVKEIDKANPYHDEKGRFTSGPGASDGGMREYAKAVAKMQGDRPSFDKLLADHGQAYAVDDKSFIGGTPHACFKNAALATTADPSLQYVEGYVSVHGVPIHHAWTVDKAGKVRDVTIPDKKGIMGYYGVPVDHDFMRKSLLAKKTYGVFTHDNAKRVTAAGPEKILAKGPRR